MSTVTLEGQPHDVALSHLALYGAAAMAEQAGLRVRLSWTQGLRPRPTLTSEGHGHRRGSGSARVRGSQHLDD